MQIIAKLYLINYSAFYRSAPLIINVRQSKYTFEWIVIGVFLVCSVSAVS